MLVSIYYSEQQNNIVLARVNEIYTEFINIESGRRPGYIDSFAKDQVLKSFVEKNYTLIGYYNE